MHNLSDDSRHSTQLEGKKLTGFGARIAESINKVIASALGISEGVELDAERGILEEEIVFDEHGQQIEERKKREAMMLADQQQKQTQKAVTTKRNKHRKESEEVKGEQEVEEKREKAVDEKEAKPEIEKKPELRQLAQQQEIAKGKDPIVPEAQQIREAGEVKLEAVAAQEQAKTAGKIDVSAASFLLGADNIKNMDQPPEVATAQQAQQESSPIKGVADLAKTLLASVLPTQLPDIREGKGQDGPTV